MNDEVGEPPLLYDDHPALSRPPMSGSGMSGVRIIKPKRTVVVEPALVAYVLFAFPMSIVSSLYILDMIEKDLIIKKGLANVSTSTNTSNPCALNKSDPAYIFQEEVQAAASYFSILLTVATGVPAFFVSLFLGPYSDQAGRKYAIVLPLIGTLASAACYVIVIAFNVSINWLFVGAVLNGFGGSFTCFMMGCFAYLADITEPEARMFRITVIEMSMFASMILSPLGITYLVQYVGYLYPFLIVGAGILLNVLYVLLLVPETVQRDPAADTRFFSRRPVLAITRLFTRDNGTDRRWQLVTLLLTMLVVMLPGMDFSLSTLFEKNSPLCWTAITIGYFTVAYVAVSSVGGIVSAKLWKCCLPDQAILLVACIGAVCYNIYKAFVQDTAMMFCSSLLGMFGVLLVPTLRAIMSKLVTEAEQGAVFGAIACVEVFCGLIGTATFNAIYANTLHIATGFVFIVMALFYFVGGIIIVGYLIQLYREKKARKFSQLLIQDQSADNYDDCNPLIN